MSSVHVLALAVLLVIQCMITLSLSAASHPFMISTTSFTSPDNRTMFITDLSTGTIVAKRPFDSYCLSSSFDHETNRYYIMCSRSFTRWNIETFTPELTYDTLVVWLDIKYDAKRKRMYGWTGQGVMECDVTNMQVNILLPIPEYAIPLGGLAYDDINHRYFVTVATDTDNFILIIDTVRGIILNKIAISDTFSEMVYDPKKDRLLALNIAGLYEMTNLTAKANCKLLKQFQISEDYLIQQGSTVLDTVNNAIYFSLSDNFEKNSLIGLDLDKLNIIMNSTLPFTVGNAQIFFKSD